MECVSNAHISGSGELLSYWEVPNDLPVSAHGHRRDHCSFQCGLTRPTICSQAALNSGGCFLCRRYQGGHLDCLCSRLRLRFPDLPYVREMGRPMRTYHRHKLKVRQLQRSLPKREKLEFHSYECISSSSIKGFFTWEETRHEVTKEMQTGYFLVVRYHEICTNPRFKDLVRKRIHENLPFLSGFRPDLYLPDYLAHRTPRDLAR